MLERRPAQSLPRRRGILLAGGTGTRLYPSTLTVSKQLLPVYDKPMIYYPLSVLMLAGIREILLISTPDHLPSFQALLADGEQLGISIQYAVQEKPRGLPEAYLIAREFLAGDPSLMVLGDNLLYGAQLPEQIRDAISNPEGACAFAYRVRDPERFGVVALDGEGRPTGLVEKPPADGAPSPWALVGLYALDGSASERTKYLAPSSRGELEMVDLLRSYLETGDLRVERLGRGISWLDAGTPSALLQAAKFVEVVQERQGLQVASPEEVAFRMGFIDNRELAELAHRLEGTRYGEYLGEIARESEVSPP